MAVILQIDFKMPAEMLGDNLSEAAKPLAESINKEPGFLSKIWTEDVIEERAGGVYQFADRASAEKYRDMHVPRVEAMGATDIYCRVFDINLPLTQINKGHIG